MPILGRFSGAAGFKEIGAAVQVPPLSFAGNKCVPVSAFCKMNPAYSGFSIFSIGAVMYGARWANVAPLIVSGFVIPVINHPGRLLPGGQKISNAMSAVGNALMGHQPIAVFVKKSGLASRFRALCNVNLPNQITRIRTIFQHFTDRFGYKFHSHSDTSYVGLVRGLTAATVSAPILSRGPFL